MESQEKKKGEELASWIWSKNNLLKDIKGEEKWIQSYWSTDIDATLYIRYQSYQLSQLMPDIIRTTMELPPIELRVWIYDWQYDKMLQEKKLPKSYLPANLNHCKLN